MKKNQDGPPDILYLKTSIEPPSGINPSNYVVLNILSLFFFQYLMVTKKGVAKIKLTIHSLTHVELLPFQDITSTLLLV